MALRVHQHLHQPPGLPVFGRLHVGVLGIAGLRIEADAFVILVVRIHGRLEAGRGPTRGCGFPARFQGGHRLFELIEREAADPRQDPGAEQRSELAGIPGDVTGRLLSTGRLGLGLGFARCSLRILHPLPFLDQARIHLTQQCGQIGLHFAQGIILGRLRDGLAQDLVHRSQMAQQQPLDALELVGLDVIGERVVLLKHLPSDGLRADVLLAHPGVILGEGVEGGIHEFPTGLRILQLLQLLHSLVVFHALSLEFSDLLALQAVELPTQDHVRILEDGFDQREDIQGVVGRFRIDQPQRVEQVQRQRLIHREVFRQLDIHPNPLALTLG